MRDESLPMARTSARRAQIAGVLLAAATVLEIAAMAHHPSVKASDAAQAVHQIAEMAALSGWVHGTLLAFMLIVVYGFSEFVLRRD